VRVGAHRTYRRIGAHLVRPAHRGHGVPAVEVPVPVEQRERVDAAVEIAPGGHLNRVHVTRDQRGRMLGPRIGEVRKNHDPALGPALPRPFGEQTLHRIAEGRLVRPTGGHRRDDGPLVAQERDVPQHVLAVLRTHAHQRLAVPTGLARAQCCPAVEVTDVRH